METNFSFTILNNVEMLIWPLVFVIEEFYNVEHLNITICTHLNMLNKIMQNL